MLKLLDGRSRWTRYSHGAQVSKNGLLNACKGEPIIIKQNLTVITSIQSSVMVSLIIVGQINIMYFFRLIWSTQSHLLNILANMVVLH